MHPLIYFEKTFSIFGMLFILREPVNNCGECKYCTMIKGLNLRKSKF